MGRDGIFLSACRYLDGVAAQVRVPLGLGGRHLAAANMSAVTKAVGIVVSEGLVVRRFCRLFCHGQLVGEIIPGFWMMDHAHRRGSVKREQVGEFMNGVHTKSATGLGREVRINFEYPERTHDNATGIQM